MPFINNFFHNICKTLFLFAFLRFLSAVPHYCKCGFFYVKCVYSQRRSKLTNHNIWDEVLDLIRPTMTEISFNTWFKPLILHRIDENLGMVYLEIKDPNFIKFVENRITTIEDAFEKIAGKPYKVVIKSTHEYAEDKRVSHSKDSLFKASKLFNPMLTFENFVVGDCNKYAHAAALAVAESPSVAYNPLFIYGGSGLGKTHLIQAIGIYITKQDPSTNVVFVSAEMFTNELIFAIKENKTRDFKNKYRKADVLIIDDIQFLEGKETTQEEFFHTFNALYENNKQIILTSDRPPNNLTQLDERLRSRFAWNLIADLQPADFETRVAILQKKAENAGIPFDDDIYEVCCLISEKIPDNIRELEGAFNRIVGFSNLLREKIDVPFARRVLRDILKDGNKVIAPERIRTVVARHYNIKVSDMDSPKRKAEINLPRQVAMYICREKTDLSFENIGKLFNRHYSTVLHAHEKIMEEYDSDPEFRKEVDKIISQIVGKQDGKKT